MKYQALLSGAQSPWEEQQYHSAVTVWLQPLQPSKSHSQIPLDAAENAAKALIKPRLMQCMCAALELSDQSCWLAKACS